MPKGEKKLKGERKIKINFSFFIIMFFVCFYLGFKQFLAAMVLLSLHEAAHGLTAVFFGLKVKDFELCPVGERLGIVGLDDIGILKRIAVFASGPIMSIFLAALLYFFDLQNYAVISLAIGIFNIIPILPMDGGKIAEEFLGRFFGSVNAFSAVSKFSVTFGFVAIVLGIIQTVLYPFNISILVIGIYFIITNRKNRNRELIRIYSLIYNDSRFRRKIKFITAKEEDSARKLSRSFSKDVYYIVALWNSGNIIWLEQKNIIQKCISAKDDRLINALENKTYF